MNEDDDAVGRADQVDPLPSLRALYRGGETDTDRATLLRARWLRREQPEATVATELAHVDDRLVVVKATVALPSGAAASGLAAESVAPDGDRAAAVAQAEHRALGAALDRLNYALVTAEADASAPEAAADGNEREGASPAPVDTPPAERLEPASGPWSTTPREPEPGDGGARPQVVEALRRMRRPEGPDTPDQAAPPQPPASDRPTPVHTDSRRPPITLRPRGSGQRTSSPTPAAAPEDDAPLEDFSWSAFWKWARQRGFTSHDELARAIGRSTQGLTPGQIRTALRETGVSD